MWQPPKVGDKVRINPEFVEYFIAKLRPDLFDEWWVKDIIKFGREDKEIEVIGLCDNDNGVKVRWSIGLRLSQDLLFGISKTDGKFWWFESDPSSPVMLLLDSETSTFALKFLNMQSTATNCAKCNSRLKEPWPGLKHCPKCEP